MKLTTLLNRSVFAALLLSASVSVFAGGGGGGPRSSQSGWHPYANTASAPAPSLAEVDVTSASAYLSPAPLGQGGAPVAAGTAVHGKTRAQVRAELLQAEEAGSIPAGNARYPAGPSLIERNRMRFQQAEEWWRASGRLNASGQ
ncbi:DUF4148 domain-containing protein [Paraburkholderia dipogonis]|uniref:DUF4148 domain-containing protein n=1 Tax=Paraburkholderia dipogonis TaxID=1211383 RepID=UPI0038B7FD78